MSVADLWNWKFEKGKREGVFRWVKRMGSVVAWRFVIRWFEQMVCGTREIIRF